MPRLAVGLLLVATAQVRACLLRDLCADARRSLPADSKPAGAARFARRGDGREEDIERGEKGGERAREKLNPKP